MRGLAGLGLVGRSCARDSSTNFREVDSPRPIPLPKHADAALCVANRPLRPRIPNAIPVVVVTFERIAKRVVQSHDGLLGRARARIAALVVAARMPVPHAKSRAAAECLPRRPGVEHAVLRDAGVALRQLRAGSPLPLLAVAVLHQRVHDLLGLELAALVLAAHLTHALSPQRARSELEIWPANIRHAMPIGKPDRVAQRRREVEEVSKTLHARNIQSDGDLRHHVEVEGQGALLATNRPGTRARGFESGAFVRVLLLEEVGARWIRSAVANHRDLALRRHVHCVDGEVEVWKNDLLLGLAVEQAEEEVGFVAGHHVQAAQVRIGSSPILLGILRRVGSLGIGCSDLQLGAMSVVVGHLAENKVVFALIRALPLQIAVRHEVQQKSRWPSHTQASAAVQDTILLRES
mmetsp:Transcript_43009/g.69458  ORF Transcript_43009/g.69458 Transcript_43009/m.69458 type:complete len:407 (-) Transcript_43009:166-1386(-)